MGRRIEHHPKGGMLCGWGVKAGMVRVWVAGTTVIPIANMGHV